MDVAAVAQAFLKVHREMQADAGQDPAAVDETTCPLGGLPGFDSLESSAEVVAAFLEQLDVALQRLPVQTFFLRDVAHETEKFVLNRFQIDPARS